MSLTLSGVWWVVPSLARTFYPSAHAWKPLFHGSQSWLCWVEAALKPRQKHLFVWCLKQKINNGCKYLIFIIKNPETYFNFNFNLNSSLGYGLFQTLSVLADTGQVSDPATQLHIRQWRSWNGGVVLATRGRTAGKDQQKSQTLLVVPQRQRKLSWRKAQVTFCLNFGMRSHVWFLVLSSKDKNHYGFYWTQLLAGTKALWKTLCGGKIIARQQKSWYRVFPEE